MQEYTYQSLFCYKLISKYYNNMPQTYGFNFPFMGNFFSAESSSLTAMERSRENNIFLKGS